VNTDRRPRALTVAFMALLAAAFFFAGYTVRTTRTAMAVVPIGTPTPTDGNPSGHHLDLPKSYTRRVSTKALTSCLQVIAKNPITIRYVTAKPSLRAALDPTCPTDGTCVPFFWPNMTLTTYWPDHHAGPESFDIYGYFDSQ
jgi:hypothetical protein